MEDSSKVRMNLVAIKKVDPYAKDIVDSSSHVAFYTFNSDKKEWEKTDVEGAFFIYSRNAQPYHSIFINNRLNTTSFVEPITVQLELQSQPPFLLYRNERSRIRGFWFYNSSECDRISNVVLSLVDECSGFIKRGKSNIQIVPSKHENVNLFKMLSDAQKAYNNTQSESASRVMDLPSNNVLEFFAAAKPTVGDKPIDQRVLVKTLSVEQIENQQRTKPINGRTKPQECVPQDFSKSSKSSGSVSETTAMAMAPSQFKSELTKFFNKELKTSKFETSPFDEKLKSHEPELSFECLMSSEPSRLSSSFRQEFGKPALMPPTMFEKTSGQIQSPLNASQLVQAFIYLMQSDEEFVHKLHDAYLQIFAKTIDTYQ